MSKLLCCDKCFERVAKKNVSSARMWLDLCRVSEEEGDYFALMDTQYFDIGCLELRVLENLGYITTTESSNMLRLRMNGRRQDDAATYFCAEGGHDD